MEGYIRIRSLNFPAQRHSHCLALEPEQKINKFSRILGKVRNFGNKQSLVGWRLPVQAAGPAS